MNSIQLQYDTDQDLSSIEEIENRVVVFDDLLSFEQSAIEPVFA